MMSLVMLRFYLGCCVLLTVMMWFYLWYCVVFYGDVLLLPLVLCDVMFSR